MRKTFKLLTAVILLFATSAFADNLPEESMGPLCDVLPELHYCNPPPPPTCEPWPECGIIDPLFAKGKTIGRPKSKKQQCLDAGYKWDSETQTCKGVPPRRTELASLEVKFPRPNPYPKQCPKGYKLYKNVCIKDDTA